MNQRMINKKRDRKWKEMETIFKFVGRQIGTLEREHSM